MSKDRNSIITKKPDTPEGIETRLKGNFTGGYVLYGYKVVDHKIVIDEDQAEIVRYIFK